MSPGKRGKAIFGFRTWQHDKTLVCRSNTPLVKGVISEIALILPPGIRHLVAPSGLIGQQRLPSKKRASACYIPKKRKALHATAMRGVAIQVASDAAFVKASLLWELIIGVK